MLNGKPLICVTSDDNFLSAGPDAPRHIDSPSAYTAAIANAGGIPLLTSEQCPEEMAELCDALLLTGGDDVDPELYGETIYNESVKPDPQRTAFEVPLTKAFLARRKPILCICRGTQLLNVMLGGDLWQDLLAQCGYVHMNGQIRHNVYAEKGSVLNGLFGDVFRTNSTHHQAIRTLAPGLRCTAKSIEGIVEAYEHETLPILATQFHPERLTGVQWDDRTPDFAPYFKYFVDLVKKHVG
jgi:putative glutamine amidotransferase